MQEASKATIIGAASVGGILGVYFFHELQSGLILACIRAYAATTQSKFGEYSKTAGDTAVKVYDKTGLVYTVDSPKCDGKERWWHVVDYDPAQRSFSLINQLRAKRNPDLSKHALASATGLPKAVRSGAATDFMGVGPNALALVRLGERPPRLLAANSI